MFKKSAAILTIFFSCHTTPQAHPRELIILLDFKQSESRIKLSKNYNQTDFTPVLGAFTFSLIPALYQQAAPILVSTSLLKNVLYYRTIFFDFVQHELPFLRQKYGNRPDFTYCSSFEIFKKHCIYVNQCYHAVNGELKTMNFDTALDPHNAAFDHLINNDRFQEMAAPKSLQCYTHPHKQAKALKNEMSTYALCAFAPLDSDHFVIKEVTQELTLLIPRAALPTHESGLCLYANHEKANASMLEKRLGLKVHHLKDITDVTELMSERPIEHEILFTKHLSSIFVTKQESGEINHSWTIYCGGHGLPAYEQRAAIKQLEALKATYESRPTTKSSRDRVRTFEKELKKSQEALAAVPPNFENIINSMPLKEFQSFLEFLETKISTRLLVYTSCFAGGIHLILPYQQTKPGEKNGLKTDTVLNYDIIAGAISDNIALQDAPLLMVPPYRTELKENELLVQGLTSDSFDLDKRKLTPWTSLRFDRFIKAVRAGEKEYHALISYLHPYTDASGSFKRENLANCAHLRRAGSKQFQLISTKAPFCEVTSANRTAIDLKGIDAVFLSSREAPTLIYPKQTDKINKAAPVIVSTVPGPVWHTIAAIDAQYYSFSDLWSSFLTLPDMKTPKLFFINKLICKQSSDLPCGKDSKFAVLYDLIIARNVYTYENCVHQATTCIYFSDAEGICYYIPYQPNGSVMDAKRVNKRAVLDELACACSASSGGKVGRGPTSPQAGAKFQ